MRCATYIFTDMNLCFGKNLLPMGGNMKNPRKITVNNEFAYAIVVLS